MRVTASLFAAAACLLLAASSPASAAAAQPATARTFVIAAADGYGVEDCLSEGGECGRVVADAWCEAHGLSAALRFGPVDDVTGDIGLATEKTSATPIVITCGD